MFNRIKTLSLYCLLSFTAGLLACKKNDATMTNQGTNFDLLLKTVTISNAVGNQYNEYTYDANSQVSQITFHYPNSGPTPSIQTENFYRNSAGKLDSIAWVGKTNGITDFTTQTYFTYDASGKLVSSINIYRYSANPPSIDSSLYLYSGNDLQKRIDYKRIGNNPYNLFLHVDYLFDVAGNITQSVFQWITNPNADTLHFRYDDKINPVPAGPNMFYWGSVYYNDYKPANNLTRALARDVSSYNYTEYKYTSNNKPLYRKENEIGSGIIAETYYYYD